MRLDARWLNFWARGQAWYGFWQDGGTTTPTPATSSAGHRRRRSVFARLPEEHDDSDILALLL